MRRGWILLLLALSGCRGSGEISVTFEAKMPAGNGQEVPVSVTVCHRPAPIQSCLPKQQ